MVRRLREQRSSGPKTMSSANDNAVLWTAKQGQYLAFIYAYLTLHGRSPAERDLEQFFRCSAPSVHTVIKTLEREGYIRRQPGVARSIELLVAPEALPVLRRPE